jgi:hypothetical protein
MRKLDVKHDKALIADKTREMDEAFQVYTVRAVVLVSVISLNRCRYRCKIS